MRCKRKQKFQKNKNQKTIEENEKTNKKTQIKSKENILYIYIYID